MIARTISQYQVLEHALWVTSLDSVLMEASPDDLRIETFARHAGVFVIEMRPASGVVGPPETVIIRLAGEEAFCAIIKRELATRHSRDAVLAIWGSYQYSRAAFISLPINGGPGHDGKGVDNNR